MIGLVITYEERAESIVSLSPRFKDTGLSASQKENLSPELDHAGTLISNFYAPEMSVA